LVAAAIVAGALAGCSDVGFGLKNHPGDCGMGIAWDDCLPGTAGYNNGGGKIHRQEVAAAAAEKSASMRSQCEQDYQDRDLDPIRDKVELLRSGWDDAPAFAVAANDSFPSDAEKPAIAKWAKLREGCGKRGEAANPIPAGATALQASFMQKDRAILKEAGNRVGELMVALYQQKLTYGEFAKKRYEITRAAAESERQFREATALADLNRQQQAQQLAQQQFQSNVMAWQAYTQSVAARQPQTVHLDMAPSGPINCTSQQFGSMVNTHCN
jgi:hypothetical protein